MHQSVRKPVVSSRQSVSHQPHPNGLTQGHAPSTSPRSPAYRGGDVHEAVRFLQAEHEAVLQGLHQQVQLLQQRCDDLQFEVHLRHLTVVEEDTLRRQISELNQQLEDRTLEATQLRQEVGVSRQEAEEAREQHRWREVQLQQQVEAGEARVVELRAEGTKLRAQVRDLRVYTSALRKGGTRPISRPSSRPAPSAQTVPRPLSRTSRASVGSQDSLESSGPRSLGSEDGETGAWKEARLGGSSRAPRTVPRASNFSLPPTLPSPPPSLPPLASLPPPRPSSSSTVVLPPITPARFPPRQVRRQMRMGSAPPLDIDHSGSMPQRDPA
ncbi:hypothetical protein Pcinc_027961 [Petrolisthes cinctipes]|uniref:CCDC92/74 N-terminal domain-containing protein n=1 Tax=Petrolisthes cinctipes TaxID=88211 RepID=A0AAE1F3D3_PETCI|nr:hypothetical protein Pcinc_027961 [Petrolisthes cinctipes]